MFIKWRHKFVYLALKFLTPTVFERITNMELSKGQIYNYYYNSVRNTPRPSIKFIKKHFGKERIKGVEVGVFKGENAKSIIKTLRIKELYLIDPYKPYHEMDFSKERANSLYIEVVNRFVGKKEVHVIRKNSFEASFLFNDKYFDFVYIDGDHSFDRVIEDLECWYPKIKDNGVLCGHDIYNSGDVYKGIKHFCSKLELEFVIDAPDFYIIKRD